MLRVIVYKTGWCLQLVEYVFFNEDPDDFFMQLNRAREADGPAGQALDSGSLRQVFSTVLNLGQGQSGQDLKKFMELKRVYLQRHWPLILIQVSSICHF